MILRKRKRSFYCSNTRVYVVGGQPDLLLSWLSDFPVSSKICVRFFFANCQVFRRHHPLHLELGQPSYICCTFNVGISERKAYRDRELKDVVREKKKFSRLDWVGIRVEQRPVHVKLLAVAKFQNSICIASIAQTLGTLRSTTMFAEKALL